LKVLTAILRLTSFVIFVIAICVGAYVALYVVLGVLKMVLPDGPHRLGL
jgi:hypothetical protein